MDLIQKLQPQIEKIKTISHRLGFEMSCDLKVANLCAIVARGCHGNWLELGTGTGLSTLFLAEVLGAGRLDTIDVKCAISVHVVQRKFYKSARMRDLPALLRMCGIHHS